MCHIVSSSEVLEHVAAKGSVNNILQGVYAKSFYMLGKIYEEKSWKGKAIENYEKFLLLWKGDDLGIPEVGDAKTQLGKLRNQ